MVFQNEIMVCKFCGFKQFADPDIESGWYVIKDNKGITYSCPKHFGMSYKFCKKCNKYYHLDYQHCPFCK